MKAKARRWDEKAVDKLKEKKEKLTDELKVTYCYIAPTVMGQVKIWSHCQNFINPHTLTICFVGANEGQEEGGRVASGSVSGPRSSDETQVFPE